MINSLKIIDSNLSPRDISICYRIGKKRGNNPRQVVCKLTSRKVQANLMRNKKKLKDSRNPNHQDVFIYEDLTPLRMNIVKLLKNSRKFQSVYTRDGRIFARNGADVKIVNNLDDLFLLGFDDSVMKELKLDE